MCCLTLYCIALCMCVLTMCSDELFLPLFYWVFLFFGNLFKLAFGCNYTHVHMSGLHFPLIRTLFGRLLIIANLAIAFLFILIGFASGSFWSLNFKIRKHSSKFEKNRRFLYICSCGCIPQVYNVSRWNMLTCELHKNENFVNFLIITNACTVHHYQTYDFFVVH